jgi:hypothetical protein
MSTATKSSEGQSSWSPEKSRPLDEAVWKAWLAKNRLEERRDAAASMKLLKVVALLFLLAVALFWLVGPSRIADLLVAAVAIPGMIVLGEHGWVSA